MGPAANYSAYALDDQVARALNWKSNMNQLCSQNILLRVSTSPVHIEIEKIQIKQSISTRFQ